MTSRKAACGLVAFAAILLLTSQFRGDDAPSSAHQHPREGVQDFDKTYRLEFKVVTVNADQSFTAVTSQSAFALRYSVRKEGEEYSITTAGTLSMLDQDGRVRVSYKFDLDRSDNNGDGFDLSNTGSAIVTLGKPKVIAHYGEYKVNLMATVVDD